MNVNELNMDIIVGMIEQEGVSAFVAQTGGGTATLYAGEPDADGQYPVAAGPGVFGYGEPSIADDREFGFGPDVNNWTQDAHVECFGKREPEIASLIAERVYAEKRK